MAPVGQIAAHLPHPSHQGPLSTMYASGIARGASLVGRLAVGTCRIWNSLGTAAGQTTEHRRQLMQLPAATWRGLRRSVTVKSPTCPRKSTTSVRVITSMLGCRLWSWKAGEMDGRVQP